jgi:hypothetical protein
VQSERRAGLSVPTTTVFGIGKPLKVVAVTAVYAP